MHPYCMMQLQAVSLQRRRKFIAPYRYVNLAQSFASESVGGLNHTRIISFGQNDRSLFESGPLMEFLDERVHISVVNSTMAMIANVMTI